MKLKLLLLMVLAILVIMWGVGLLNGTFYEAYWNVYYSSDYSVEQDIVMMLIIGFLLLIVPLYLIWYTRDK